MTRSSTPRSAPDSRHPWESGPITRTVRALPLWFAAMAIAAAGAAADQNPAASPQLVHAMSDVSENSVPLFAVGDVNEDGQVDSLDRQLIGVLAEAEESVWTSIEEASCPAAADLTMDGLIDQEDLALADELMVQSRIVTPALFFQAALPCRFERLLVAIEPFAISGEDMPIWLLRQGYGHTNTEITVESGPAVIRETDRRRVYMLEVATSAKDAETILLKVLFDHDEAYWLAIPVTAPGSTG